MSIDKYDPIRILGEGSFGKVYLMRDKVRRTFVCVKVIKIKNIPKKEREATRMEVDLLRRLNHPNIVRYIDSFLSKNNDSLCICMEYCDGGDLASQIKAARRVLFGESKILHWFVQLGLGLHYMHTNKVLHRDLKTQNVFLLGNGRLVLGDLGISKVLDGTMDFAQTCIGTPYYMSPEIFQNKPYSYKSDVWALGCVLYEMTTLNHAFDANSLNGLAGKIVKGRYPPIAAKYSKHLRDLIAQMLLLNPQARPDMDQILRKPFIKKHIVNFFTDIAARPSAGVGEGTMIVRAAAGAGVGGALSNDSNVIALQKQLHALDMTLAVQEALEPKDVPADSLEAKKLVKEQAGALRREKEHKQMVEAALDKLRQERENRAKIKQQAQQAPQSAYGAGPSQPSARRDEPSRPAAYRQPSPTPFVAPQQPAKRPSDAVFAPASAAVAAAAAARDRFSQQPGVGGNGGGGMGGAGGLPRGGELPKRNPSVSEERRAVEERRKAEAEQERRREDERIRYEARVKEESRLRDEAAAKQKSDQLKAQADASARRDQQRDRERQRQRDEIDQLKRDKLELDRRAMERDRVREERREEERRKLEDARKQSESHAQEKSIPGEAGRNSGGASYYLSRAEEKEAAAAATARRQDKLARDELDRSEALRAARAAEEENRRLRAIANNRLYSDSTGKDKEKESVFRGNSHQPVSSVNRYQGAQGASGRVGAGTEAETRSKAHADDLAQKLNDVTQGRNRFGDPSGRRVMTEVAGAGGRSGYSSGTASDDEGDEGEVMWSEETAAVQIEEEEDMRRREDELREELNMATLRCEELKRTLLETKSFIDPRDRGERAAFAVALGAREERRRPPQVSTIVSAEEEEDDMDELDDEEEETYEDEEDGDGRDTETPVKRPPRPGDIKQGGIGYAHGRASSSDDINNTPRTTKPTIAAVKQSPYYGLQDAPSPVGRLSDRIQRLRQRCVEALGRDSFEQAHSFLQMFEESHATDGRLYEEDLEEEKVSRMRAILGEGKAHYMPLIEQLIFMEETHG